MGDDERTPHGRVEARAREGTEGDDVNVSQPEKDGGDETIAAAKPGAAGGKADHGTSGQTVSDIGRPSASADPDFDVFEHADDGEAAERRRMTDVSVVPPDRVVPRRDELEPEPGADVVPHGGVRDIDATHVSSEPPEVPDWADAPGSAQPEVRNPAAQQPGQKGTAEQLDAPEQDDDDHSRGDIGVSSDQRPAASDDVPGHEPEGGQSGTAAEDRPTPGDRQHASTRSGVWNYLKSGGDMPRLWIITTVVAGMAIALVFGWKHWSDGSGPKPKLTQAAVHNPAVTSSARPASKTDPPVLVETVTGMRSQGPPGTMALSAPLTMTPTALKTFNNTTYPNTATYDAWYRSHHAASVDFGIINVTIVGNRDERVGIANITVDKTCGPPLTGTHFDGYSQGNSPTTRIGFDLDSPNPRAEELADTPERGLFPDGNDFFAVNQTNLDPGERTTLTIGAYTKKYDCSFTLVLLVSTAHGSYTERIDNGGTPFQVTATARTPQARHPFAGYRQAYVLGPIGNEAPRWKLVDPQTWTR